MCPKAAGPAVKYMWLDHDGQYTNIAPPTQNQWYSVFHEYNVLMLFCVIYQYNNEAAGKMVEVRWIIDGTTHFAQWGINDNTPYWVRKNEGPSQGGNAGLTIQAAEVNAGLYIPKHGQDFEVQIRMTSLPGTNQGLDCTVAYETLEQTPY